MAFVDADVWPEPLALHNGACHTPRPNVAAVSTCAGAVAGEAFSSTTGASGNPLPNADQQVDDALAQPDTCVVKKTPTSVAR
jgi:hypothetical protein